MSRAHPWHKFYPYLLHDVPVMRPDQVWSIDTTYIRLARSVTYLVAISDWHSRKGLSVASAIAWARRYLKEYANMAELKVGLAQPDTFYNAERTRR